MSKIVVLGGCGGIGSVAVRSLASGDYFDELVIADVRAELAQKAAAGIGKRGVSGVAVDALDPRSLQATIAGAAVVLNCIGPFYKFGPPVLQAAIDARVAYVDVCDDLAPTRRMLEMDAAARDAGVAALIGMGNSTLNAIDGFFVRRPLALRCTPDHSESSSAVSQLNPG